MTRLKVTSHHLIALAAVSQTGSLTGASVALGKTQPAVSAHLRQLSEAVGAPLLVRHRYGVRLAPAAEELLPYAQACVRALEGAQRAAERLRGLEAGRLRVLASTSVAVYVLPPVLAAFHARYPGIDLGVSRHNAKDAMEALEQGLGEVAVVRGPVAITPALTLNFVIRALVQDRTVLVVRRDHPLAKRRLLQPRQLDGIEIVRRETGSATGALVERMAEREGIRLKVKFQTVGVEALKEAILQGFGAGFLSRLAVRREIESGALVAVEVQAPELVQHITLAHPATGQSSPAAQKFVEILQERLERGKSRPKNPRHEA